MTIHYAPINDQLHRNAELGNLNSSIDTYGYYAYSYVKEVETSRFPRNAFEYRDIHRFYSHPTEEMNRGKR